MTPVTLKLTRKSQREAVVRKQDVPVLFNEHVQQSFLMQWAETALARYPELVLLFAIPNAGGFSGGFKKNVGRVQKLKAEGVKSGVPDLCLPVARGVYHSLYIEMKVGKNRPTDAQRDWHMRLRAQGNAVRVCYSHEQARAAIEHYLSGQKFPSEI